MQQNKRQNLEFNELAEHLNAVISRTREEDQDIRLLRNACVHLQNQLDNLKAMVYESGRLHRLDAMWESYSQRLVDKSGN